MTDRLNWTPPETYAVRVYDHRQTCSCGHRFADHATGGTHCLGASMDEEQVTGAGMCPCSSWIPLFERKRKAFR